MLGTSSWPTCDGAPPLHATPRNLALRSEGAQVEAVARALGTPLLPWQRRVADVAGERRPDGSYEHQVIVVSVPRQSGKTALLRAIGTHRAMLGRSVFYTAQTGKDARARWSDLVKALRLSPAFAGKMKSEEIKVALRGGSEHVEFPTGGVFQAFAPTVESLHGYTPPSVLVDEAFAQSQANGELLIGAIEPAQRTIVDRQLWLVSTMGTAESTWFHDWIERARLGVDRVALFLWGASEDQDPFDVDDIAAFHPAVGFEFREVGHDTGLVTTAESILAAADKMSRSEYIRAYGNRKTSTAETLIPAEDWAALSVQARTGDDTATLAPPADRRDVTLVYDVDEHAAAAAIVAVWEDEATGLPAAKVVQSGPGVSWLADAVADLDVAWRPGRVVAVGNGPVLDVTAQVRGEGVDVDELNERDFAAATTGLLVAVTNQQLVHDGDPVLASAIGGLVTRSSVVDGVAFSRRHSVGSTAAAIALAAGLHRHRHAPAGAPLIRF
ncbi:hypothetical protein ACJ5H2_05950 [Nocardioides sp. R1-1]|uniref:hypothetical protein n=1 Tax=Nocardioides sp. R1-1 TaxID=3383502 RepID=UPI0038D16007